MKKFALMHDGLVVEVFDEYVTVGEGSEAINVPLSDRYHADFVAQLVEYDPANPPRPPAPPAPAIPTSVTMRQARLALLAAGKLSLVTQAIDSLPTAQRAAAQIEWEFAATVERDSTLVEMLAQGLSLDDAALDTLFTAAAVL